jgi:hypothetical protein
MTRTLTTRRTQHDEQGAVAVEAAIFLTVVLLPLLLGVITYGMYFWKAQQVAPLSQRLPLDSIVGQFNCAQLVDRVKTTVQNALPSLTGLVQGPLPLTAIGVTVVNVLPTVGADVSVSITIPGGSTLGGLLPLPNGGNVVSEATYRLDNVTLTTAGC